MENINERVFERKRSRCLERIIGGSVPLKNKSKFASQKEEKKNDALALKTIFNGLSSSVK
jgi:hypothetical protein